MSWDISIQNLPADAASLADIPNDYRPEPLGPLQEVIKRVQEVFPAADFSDPSWGLLRNEEFSIEFNMGRHEICNGFMLHVRGGGGVALAVERLLRHLNLRGIDCQIGEFFSLEAAEASFKQWREFRDRVVSQSSRGP
jgi:hypothetical protein